MFKSREINIGGVTMGAGNPVRIQSMTSTDTMDIDATLRQSLALAEAGSSYVRITAPSLAAAKKLESIKNEIEKRGIRLPLIADIHFNPAAAEIAAKIVDKVRINPGNYIDRKYVRKTYNETDYQLELRRISERIAALLDICKTNNTAIRIGTNHGSLPARILEKFGNTAEGMVQSTLEYVDICRAHDFHQLVLSIKSSNLKVMIDAYRLLVQKMRGLGYDYPLHLGVTEAGDAEDGRIKSAAGIGTLLSEGIGDTIRVSLTEDPVKEIPVAQKILKYTGEKRLEKHSAERVQYFLLPAGAGENLPLVIGSTANPKSDFYEENGLFKDQAGRQYSWESIKDPAERNSNALIVIKRKYEISDKEEFLVRSAMDFAPEVMHDSRMGVWIDSSQMGTELAVQTAFDILQASGKRISKTEFISCPSCGRTMFDIEKTLGRVKERTAHLKGLKIGVMGCIVNGPGEMADADYGYVGSGRGKITLYKGREVKKRNVEEKHAIDELVDLIKSHGDWVEPANA